MTTCIGAVRDITYALHTVAYMPEVVRCPTCIIVHDVLHAADNMLTTYTRRVAPYCRSTMLFYMY